DPIPRRSRLPRPARRPPASLSPPSRRIITRIDVTCFSVGSLLDSKRGGSLQGLPAGVAAPLLALRGGAAPKPEESAPHQQVDDDRQVAHQGRDLEPRETGGELIHPEREKQRGGDERQVLGPALLKPETDRLGRLQYRESDEPRPHQPERALLQGEEL